MTQEAGDHRESKLKTPRRTREAHLQEAVVCGAGDEMHTQGSACAATAVGSQLRGDLWTDSRSYLVP